MKKLRLKKKFKKLLILLLVVIVISTFGIKSFIKEQKRKEYEKTYEYKLISAGYTKEDTTTLLDKYKNKEIEYILNNKKEDIYLNIINEKYFIYDNFYKYLEYYDKSEDKELYHIISIVNTNRDKDFYTDTIDTDISKEELMLVNKYYHLNSTYEPTDLVVIPTTYAWGNYGDNKVTQKTYDAYLKMWNASHENGFYLMVSSSYRTYNHQQEVFDDYKKKRGEEYALSIAALPGHSEHQTGYSLDIFEKGYTQKSFQDSESYHWLKENAHLYGFIERYPIDKVNITGYNYESWHYRYVGVEAATYIHNNNITFDEYYAYFVK